MKAPTTLLSPFSPFSDTAALPVKRLRGLHDGTGISYGHGLYIESLRFFALVVTRRWFEFHGHPENPHSADRRKYSLAATASIIGFSLAIQLSPAIDHLYVGISALETVGRLMADALL
ncbi:hypothetical protein D9756_011156 [Leucocoprinus leucothites]|uniref:Uncharacterized protein n=1 Tax=Leucocoprinus leucothites TaxID=201217 RepID=A0A8H5CNP7_9AGAR|nr:hypothetical protein D9756_011156 [Leucoagaricus leucothites]